MFVNFAYALWFNFLNHSQYLIYFISNIISCSQCHSSNKYCNPNTLTSIWYFSFTTLRIRTFLLSYSLKRTHIVESHVKYLKCIYEQIMLICVQKIESRNKIFTVNILKYVIFLCMYIVPKAAFFYGLPLEPFLSYFELFIFTRSDEEIVNMYVPYLIFILILFYWYFHKTSLIPNPLTQHQSFDSEPNKICMLVY